MPINDTRVSTSGKDRDRTIHEGRGMVNGIEWSLEAVMYVE